MHSPSGYQWHEGIIIKCLTSLSLLSEPSLLHHFYPSAFDCLCFQCLPHSRLMPTKNSLEARSFWPSILGSKWLLHFGRWCPWLPESSSQHQGDCKPLPNCLLPLCIFSSSSSGFSWESHGVRSLCLWRGSTSAHSHNLMPLSGIHRGSYWAKSLLSSLA